MVIGSVICSLTAHADNTKYYKELTYNHVSPYINLYGSYELEKVEKNDEYYAFTYDEKDRLIEVVNHGAYVLHHPLTSYGTYKMSISYQGNKESRAYFDKQGESVKNGRGVYKEVYLYNNLGEKQSLSFYDLEGKAVQSKWNIATYKWHKKNDLVIEQRFDLKGKAKSVSPYFDFGITAIKLNDKGLPIESINIDQQGNPKAASFGVASYKDHYNEHDQHVKSTYHNTAGGLQVNQWGTHTYIR